MCAVVLTGMGADGKEGARTAKLAGARIIAEDPRTAVMPGMPQSAIATGIVDEVIPLEGIAAAIVRFVDSLNG
jgi:two-component system chemotaxis response regulator CheB